MIRTFNFRITYFRLIFDKFTLMFLFLRTLFLSALLLLVSCKPSEDRVEITKTRELGDFAPKPKLGLAFKDRVGIEERKPESNPLNNVSFFVKMTGPKATVDAEIENFNLFCDSLKIGEGNPPFKWSKPESWNEESASTMRVANFSFGENSLGVCYFTVLPGGGGGLVANVNRWRKQMGLDELNQSDVDALKEREFLLGNGKYIEMEGSFKPVGANESLPNYKMVGIILPELNMNFEK